MTGVDLIIFGASGDLSARKLFPALFQLDRAELLPSDLRITAIARDQVDVDVFLEGLRQRMNAYMGPESPSDAEWQHYSRHFQYVGAGVGVRDVAYFIYSIYPDHQRLQHYQHLLDVYFYHAQLDQQVEQEWRGLFPVCVVDFHRFLLGWSGPHSPSTFADTMLKLI